MPVRLSLTAGTVGDCTQASDLIAGLAAEYLLADRAYDTDVIVAEALAQGMEPVIPSKSNRKDPGLTTITCISCDTWWKTRSSTSNNGGEWQPAMPRTPLPSWLSVKLEQW